MLKQFVCSTFVYASVRQAVAPSSSMNRLMLWLAVFWFNKHLSLPKSNLWVRLIITISTTNSPKQDNSLCPQGTKQHLMPWCESEHDPKIKHKIFYDISFFSINLYYFICSNQIHNSPNFCHTLVLVLKEGGKSVTKWDQGLCGVDNAWRRPDEYWELLLICGHTEHAMTSLSSEDHHQ